MGKFVGINSINELTLILNHLRYEYTWIFRNGMDEIMNKDDEYKHYLTKVFTPVNLLLIISDTQYQ